MILKYFLVLFTKRLDLWRGLKIVALKTDIAVLSTICWVRNYCYETINFHNFIEKLKKNKIISWTTSQLNKEPMDIKQMQENPSAKVSLLCRYGGNQPCLKLFNRQSLNFKTIQGSSVFGIDSTTNAWEKRPLNGALLMTDSNVIL